MSFLLLDVVRAAPVILFVVVLVPYLGPVPYFTCLYELSLSFVSLIEEPLVNCEERTSLYQRVDRTPLKPS